MEGVKKEVIVKPIVYGNVSTNFGKKREDKGHTHQWTVYVRPYSNEDMSVWVKKVQFTLHETFENRIRQITQPPYEVTETGWGEFDILITLFFNDPDCEDFVTLSHHVKLFPGKQDVIIKAKNLLVSEVYDEIVFTNPSPMMGQILRSTRPLVLGNYAHETDFDEQKLKQLKAFEEAQIRIDKELREWKLRRKQTGEAIDTENCVRNGIVEEQMKALDFYETLVCVHSARS
ncbi:unnamed protein product [Notodromas monacha]|uniref:YEATS domain-containing protein n=1 Tax=Notodromas monacha TaxID=399045 RepID=A0A7R9BI76_9CRUS|nr:unnamed protein product [Notodromas monacha]CAG0915197.1 unnamed protein product [Notodromas monacha]